MKKLLALLVIMIFCLTTNAFALFNGPVQNNNPTIINGAKQCVTVKPVQNNKQTTIVTPIQNTSVKTGDVKQGQLQGQKQIDNSVLIIKGNEREYVQPADIKFSNAPSGHNESRKSKGRRYISIEDQTMFTKVWTVKRAKKMFANIPYGTKVNIIPMVDIGDYPATKKITIVTNKNSLPEGTLVEIALAPGNCKGRSNSALITAKTVIKGAAHGATHLLVFNSKKTERKFKHRGLGGGGGGSDAANVPSTVLSGVFSGHLGSSRYEEFPYQFGYLVRIVD